MNWTDIIKDIWLQNIKINNEYWKGKSNCKTWHNIKEETLGYLADK